MEAKHSFETSVDFQDTTLRHIPEYRNLHNHRCENLKFYIIFFQFDDQPNEILREIQIVAFFCIFL
jgi:hypothetical protein